MCASIGGVTIRCGEVCGAVKSCDVLVLKFGRRAMMSRAGIWVKLGSGVGTCVGCGLMGRKKNRSITLCRL